MTFIKNIFFFLFLLFCITIVLLFIFLDKYKIEKIIDRLETDNNIIINLKNQPNWKFSSEIKVDFSTKIQNEKNQFYTEDANFSFVQPYKIAPMNFDINIPSLFLEGLKIKLVKLIGNYNLVNKKINFNNIEGKIGNGDFSSSGSISLLNNQPIRLKGELNNIYLNQILKQLNLADWKRLEIRLSANNYEVSSKLSSDEIFLKNFNGNIPITGSIYLVSSEEEKFGVALLNILVAQLLPDYQNLSKSLSQIINNYTNKPVLFEGIIEIKNGVLHTSNMTAINNNNKIQIKGTFDMVSNNFDTKLFFIESEKIVVEAKIAGDLENPKIEIINENKSFDSEKINNDLNKVFGEGINNLIDKLLMLNE